MGGALRHTSHGTRIEAFGIEVTADAAHWTSGSMSPERAKATPHRSIFQEQCLMILQLLLASSVV
jgi:hypothetical protein